MLLSSSPPVLKTGSHQLGLRPPKDLVLLGDLACCPAANFRRHKVLDCKHRQKSPKKPIAIFNLNISLRTLLTFSHCTPRFPITSRDSGLGDGIGPVVCNMRGQPVNQISLRLHGSSTWWCVG